MHIKNLFSCQNFERNSRLPIDLSSTMNFFLSFVVSLKHELEPHCRGKKIQFVECTLIVHKNLQILTLKMWERDKNTDKRRRRFINLIIFSLALSPFLLPSCVHIWFSIVHSYLCQSQIWFCYITWTWKGTCVCVGNEPFWLDHLKNLEKLKLWKLWIRSFYCKIGWLPFGPSK